MSDDIHRKRAFVVDMYPGKKGWKTKVSHMSDIQVTAIYLKEKAKGPKPKPKEKPQDETLF
jgi:hypothetical protein